MNNTQPELRKTDHWEHQCEAYHAAFGRPATMLAMEMGTGKSLVCLSIIANEKHGRVLILCPRSVLGVWRREIEKHYPGDARVVILDGGTSKDKAAKVKQTIGEWRTTFVVANYESAWREPLGSTLLAGLWQCVVLDESHRIKAPGGKASRWCQRIGRTVKRRLCLTGTPMPHSPLDLYGQYRFLSPEIFGTSFTRFRARYAICNPQFPSQVRQWINQDELQERFGRIAYICKSADVLDLPEVIHDDRIVELSPKASRIYDDLRNELMAEIDGGVIVAGNALVKLLRLQQVTSGFVRDESGIDRELCTAKESALGDLLEDIDQPAVVFCRFRRDLDTVALASHRLGRVYGELSGERRDLTPHATMPDGIDVMGVQIQSGGVGVDLTRACYGIYYSIGFSLGDYLQSLARIHRPGQRKCVRFYHLVAKGTVDETVYMALTNREEVIESVLKGLTRGNQSGRRAIVH